MKTSRRKFLGLFGAAAAAPVAARAVEMGEKLPIPDVPAKPPLGEVTVVRNYKPVLYMSDPLDMMDTGMGYGALIGDDWEEDDEDDWQN